MFEDRTSPGKTRRAALRPRALLFDLDGTLVDSVGDLQACLNRLLASRALPVLTRTQVRAMVGDGVRMLLERALRAVGGDARCASLDAAVAAFMADYLAHPAEQTRPYPGVVETLAALRGAGLALAVCTNKPQAASVAVLGALGLGDFFSAVVGGDSTPARKPDPQPLQLALDRLGVHAAEALMVGDGVHDAEAAAAAGIAFVGVDYGYGRDSFATLARPPRLISRFADLPEVLPVAAGAHREAGQTP